MNEILPLVNLNLQDSFKEKKETTMMETVGKEKDRVTPTVFSKNS